jgi:hypothetical protein
VLEIVGIAHLVRGEVWIIGPVTFKVFNNLTNDSLLAAEGYIRKISKMHKKPAHLGEAAQVVALVVGRNADRQHRAPMALTPLIIIRWGPDASSDRLRASVRCSVCGCKGADLQTGVDRAQAGRRTLDSASRLNELRRS